MAEKEIAIRSEGKKPERGMQRRGSFSPDIEVTKRDGNLFVRADLPGLEAKDLHVHVDDEGLVISGERKLEHDEKGEGWQVSGRSYSSFQHRIPLPKGADTGSCDASFDDGVLEVKIDLTKN